MFVRFRSALRTRRRVGAAGLALVLGTSTILAGPASAAPIGPDVDTRSANRAGLLPADVPPATMRPAGLAEALRRDLGLTPEQAVARLAATDTASRITQRLHRDLGDRFGGAWLDADGRVVAAVTDRAALAAARATGAQARLVRRGEAALAATAARLDRAARSAPPEVVGWYVDLATDQVVVQTRAGAAGGAAATDQGATLDEATAIGRDAAIDRATAFATGTGAARDAIRISVTSETPRPLVDVRGGDPFFTASGGRCTVGFTVVGGFLTAGHCGRAGDLVYAGNGQVMGVFQASSYPGNDYAWVRLNPGWTPVGQVRGGSTGFVNVSGATEAPVGATICRYGSTTGWRCGTVQAKNQTVYYAGGSVSGLTRTNVCAEAGDSAGPFMAGNQAQGILSGGSGNCTSGGTSYFQPVREPLAAYGLTLLTAS